MFFFNIHNLKEDELNYHFDTLVLFQKGWIFFFPTHHLDGNSVRDVRMHAYLFIIYTIMCVCVCRVFFATELRDHVKSLIDHVATDPRYMLIEAAEGGCLEDAPWCWTNIAEEKKLRVCVFFSPLAAVLFCCGVWDKTST